MRWEWELEALDITFRAVFIAADMQTDAAGAGEPEPEAEASAKVQTPLPRARLSAASLPPPRGAAAPRHPHHFVVEPIEVDPPTAPAVPIPARHNRAAGTAQQPCCGAPPDRSRRVRLSVPAEHKVVAPAAATFTPAAEPEPEPAAESTYSGSSGRMVHAKQPSQVSRPGRGAWTCSLLVPVFMCFLV